MEKSAITTSGSAGVDKDKVSRKDAVGKARTRVEGKNEDREREKDIDKHKSNSGEVIVNRKGRPSKASSFTRERVKSADSILELIHKRKREIVQEEEENGETTKWRNSATETGTSEEEQKINCAACGQRGKRQRRRRNSHWIE